MFDKQTLWTECPCLLRHGLRAIATGLACRAVSDRRGAAEVLPRVRRWAIRQSGDRNAASYRYEVMRHFNGDTHSILGILTP